MSKLHEGRNCVIPTSVVSNCLGSQCIDRDFSQVSSVPCPKPPWGFRSSQGDILPVWKGRWPDRSQHRPLQAPCKPPCERLHWPLCHSLKLPPWPALLPVGLVPAWHWVTEEVRLAVHPVSGSWPGWAAAGTLGRQPSRPAGRLFCCPVMHWLPRLSFRGCSQGEALGPPTRDLVTWQGTLTRSQWGRGF